MIIECHVCSARVDGNVIVERWFEDPEEPPFLVVLMECPQCGGPLLGGHYDGQDTLDRLWPFLEEPVPWEIPEAIRNSLEEAVVCFKAGAHNACTVMAGRALEGICRHFGTQQTYLGPGIQQLRDKEIIDARLATWAKELQRARNLSAHASGEKVSREDAKDLLDFVKAICEYIFVLTRKYEAFMKRRAKGQGTLESSEASELDEPA